MTLPDRYKKRSFLEFDVPIDLASLLAEVRAIPAREWVSSYWGRSHCSVGTLLLRGGTSGTEDDYWTEEEASDHPLLRELPTVAGLLDGPFGTARYAFIFRMRPNGVTLRHRDRAPVWQTMYRIHVPLVTNPGAFLISGQRSLHLTPGRAWTFDNQEEHGVVNGDQERVHLIFDVPFTATLAARIDHARLHRGECVAEHLARIAASDTHATASYPGDRAMAELIGRYRHDGLSDEQIAQRLNAENVPPKRYFAEEPGAAPRWTPLMIAGFGSG